MNWQALLATKTTKTLPWLGGRKLHGVNRSWSIAGKTPNELGWYEFEIDGSRKAKLVGPAEMPDSTAEPAVIHTGYIVGDRFIADGGRVDPDHTKLIEQTERLWLVEPGIERFSRGTATRNCEGQLLYRGLAWPLGPEAEVQAAYQDRLDALDHIKDVRPALDLAFRWESWGRVQAEERRRELERLRAVEQARLEAEARVAEAMENAGTALGRRRLAVDDFEGACREALRVSNSELLDVRDSFTKGEAVVQYRFRHRRLECVVDKATLRIIDAGICLEDHRTGVKGDTFFTLESLPGAVGEALDLGKLVVWRHVPGDDRRWRDDNREGEDDDY